MSEQQSGNGGFAKAFVPGLVLGLVIGAFVGATLPPILGGKKLPPADHNAATPGPREREEVPMPVEEPLPQDLEQPSADEPTGAQTPPGEAGDGAGEDAGGG